MSEASFHARITADVSQFKTEVASAAATLATLVKASEKTSKVSPKASSTAKKSASEVEDVYSKAQRASQKLHEQNLKNIASEGKARGQAASGGGSKWNAKAIPGIEGDVNAPALYAARMLLEQRISQSAKNNSRQNTEFNRIALVEMRNREAAEKASLKEREKFNRIYGEAIREDARRSAKAQQRQLDAMVTGRYALYDLASSYDLVGRSAFGLAAAFGSTVLVAAQFETAFTAVERSLKPLPDEINSIKQQLIDLSTEMPVAFADISKIATLGAQMGIGASGIESFTRTIAEFSAVTGVTVDEAAQSYGRIASLTNTPQDEFEKLGSAILYAGNNAVATEQQILRMTESIAGATTLVGYSADQTVGLATAFASLGIAPEAARGVITRVFADISRVVDTGGEKLKTFANVSGMTAGEVKKLWAESPDKFFSSLLRGIGTAENFTKTMDSLGFTETRETTLLTKLAKNLDVVNKSMSDSAMSYESGTALGDAYAKTADNLQSKITMLTNSLQAMADSIGASMVGPFGDFISVLEGAAIALTEFAKTPIGASITPIVAGLSAIAGTALLLKGATSRATAQIFAMRTAMIQLGRVGEIGGSFRELASTMMGMTRAVKNQRDEIVFLSRSQAKAQGLLKQWEIGNIDASRTIRDLDGRIVSMTRNQAISAGVVERWDASAKRATATSLMFSRAVNAIGIVGAVVAVGSLIAGMVNANEESRKLDLIGSGGGLASLREAITKDTQVWMQTGESIALFRSNVEGTTNVTDEYATAIKRAGSENDAVDKSVKKSTASISQQTVALGENAKEWVYNSIILNDKVRAAFESVPDFMGKLEDAGFNFSDVINSVIADPASIDKVTASLDKQIAVVNDLIGSVRAGAGVILGGKFEGLNANDLEAQRKALEQTKGISIEVANELKKAIEYSKMVNAIKGFSPEFLGLDTVLQGVKQGSAEYVAAINKIRAALKLIAKRHDVKIDFDGQTTVEGMIKVVKAARQAEIALMLVANASGNIEVAARAINAKYDELLTNLNLISGGTDDVASSAGKAKTALEKMQEAITKVFASTRAIMDVRNAVRSLAQSLSDNSSWNSFTEAGTTNLNNLLGLIDAIVIKSKGNKQAAVNDLAALKIAMAQMGLGSAQSVKVIDMAIKSLGLTGKATKAEIEGFVNALKNGAKAIPLKEFKTALDYANDLGSVLKRAFDLRYGKQIALDEIWSQWNKLKEEAEAAKDAINAANEAMKSLQADKNILEYQLRIAVKYGDTLRADALRARIAESNTKIAAEQKKVAAAQEDQDKSLTGNSKAAVKNRATVRGLVSTYTDYLGTLAASGMSAEDLKKEAAKLSAEFLAQGQALGFSTTELGTYTKAFEGDFKTAINNLPSTVTLKLGSTDPIITAIAEFVGKANAELGKINIVDLSGKVTTVDTGTGGKETADLGFKDEPNPAYTTWSSGRVPLVTTYNAAVKAWNTAKLAKKSAATIAALYTKVAAARAKITAWDSKKPAATVKTPITAATGGYISGAGTGVSDSIPAMLSNGEYVIRANAVSRYGVDFMNAVNNMQVSRAMPSGQAAMASAGSQIIHLSPEDRSLLRQAIDRPVTLYADSTKIAQSANAGNQVLAQRGSR